MTHHNDHNDHNDRNERNDPRRNTMSASDMDRRKEPEPARKPSQAEGDRQTIEEDLTEKESQGEL